MAAYYNEIDPFAAQWLRNLIAAGHIAPGDVDERSITEIKPDELKQYTQCHFFAGIGVWSYALRRAGWGDSRPVWTGSCPCQPFSAAGKGEGIDDERHLWPAWSELVSEYEPPIVFGEQVASDKVVGKSDGSSKNVWIDTVSTDLERALYAVAAFDLPAAGFGAPHIRQRTWFVAERLGDAISSRPEGHGRLGKIKVQEGRQGERRHSAETGLGCGLAITKEQQHDRSGPKNAQDGQESANNSRMVDTNSHGLNSRSEAAATARHGASIGSAGRDDRADPSNGHWADPDWLWCRDNKWRAVESGTSPLVNGATQRVGRLRAYGNAICAEVATGFITAYMGNN